MWSVCSCCWNLMGLEFFSTEFRKILKYKILWKSVQRELGSSMRTDGRTDMTKLIVAFRNFANAPDSSTFCPHSVFVCSVWIWEQTAIISLYSFNWLVCVTETECVYCAVRTGSLYIIQVMCFVWIWEQTAIISLYSINWLVCITETECVYCAVRTGCLYIIGIIFFNI